MAANISLAQRKTELLNAVDKIFLRQSAELSFVQGYSHCYFIVIEQSGENLYKATKKIISEHLRDRIQPIVTQDLCNNRLEIINKKWEDLNACGRKVRDILLFLDSNYAHKENLLEVFEMVAYIFRDLIIRNDIISQAMQHVIFGMIIAERQGNVIDYPAIKTAINLLLDIGEENNQYSEYDRLFESKFLENSTIFYKREAQNLLEINNAVEYLRNYESRLAEEKERISRYLNKRTENKIMVLVEDILIKENLNNIIELEYGLNKMLEENRVLELQKLYSFFKKYNQINDFHEVTGQFFSANANSIVDCIGCDMNSQEKAIVIENLLKLRLKFINLIKECFDNNNDLKQIVDNMYTVTMSSKSKTSEYLVCYIHEKMRKYEKNTTDIQIDQELDEFIELFKLVTEKDIFERHYQKRLASRLLNRKANLDIENKFIGKLQIECGNDFISSFKNMTKDITVNETIMEDFNKEITTNNTDNIHGIDFSINVLCSKFWPPFLQYPSINLPKNMDQYYQLYMKFYQGKHKGRKVLLQNNLGQTQIKAHFEAFENRKKRQYILEGFTLQAVILDVFNNSDSFTYNEIQAKTLMPEGNLTQLLTQLVKKKILLFEEKNEGITKIYSVNLGFFIKKSRYDIKSGKCIETNRKEKEKLDEQIINSRNLEIEAAIVRIMKMNKVLQSAVLQSEVIGILKNRFTPSVDVIKKNIKNLIERQYIEYRDNDTKKLYYLE